jgi:hypothetical protein
LKAPRDHARYQQEAFCRRWEMARPEPTPAGEPRLFGAPPKSPNLICCSSTIEVDDREAVF